MLDKNVGDALLKLDLAPTGDPPSDQIERIIEADHRRVRRWTRISIALWIIAALGAMFIFVMGGLVFPMIAKLLQDEHRAAVANAAAANAAAADSDKAKEDTELKEPLDQATPFAVLAKLVAMTMVLGTASFMVLVFAGLATVLLLLRSRSATLRQINANLLQISEQLKGSPPSTAP
jgi:hypothetical protein